ncbi:MAG TPA: hypothetical protein VD861_02385 [Pyrinomonadaceae bacterium]|nr:hypothetical protein [Pyrinomonadaceae bacterium]
MKQCYRCKIIKDTSEFHRYARNRDGVQSYCSSCKKEIDRRFNEQHPRRNYGRTREYARRNLRWLHEFLKAKQCEWEGCTINDPDVLVFDHINLAEKREHVSIMVHSSFGLKSIQEEVAKCRALCANHHQKHAIQQFGYKKWLTED